MSARTNFKQTLSTLVLVGESLMRISTLARRSGCNVKAIRQYEKHGLLPIPSRTLSGYRDYLDTDIQRLAFIERNFNLGFRLPEIRELVSLQEDNSLSKTEAGRRTQYYLDKVTVKQAQLELLRASLQRRAKATKPE